MHWSFLVGLVAGTTLGTAAWWLHYYKTRKRRELLQKKDECFLFSPHQFDLKCVKKRKGSCKSIACPTCNFRKVVAIIKSARTHLDVCLYLITSDELAKVLVNLSNKGVFVRIILDKDMSDLAYSSKVVVFAKEHIPLKIVSQGEIMHNKFAIIDKKKVVTGSMNWTKQAAYANYESCVLIHNEKVVQKFLDYFQDIWLLIDDDK